MNSKFEKHFKAFLPVILSTTWSIRFSSKWYDSESYIVETPKASQSSDSLDGESVEMEEEAELYDCVICGQSTPSTAEKTVGLVVFLQASSGTSQLSSSQICSSM